MEEPSTITRNFEPEHGTLASYATGFGLSVAFTLLAFWMAAHHALNGHRLMLGLLGLAIVQFIVQIIFFLHIGQEAKPRWKRLMLVLMLVFVLIVVLGSIWLMYSLNYRMTPDQINNYMLKQDGGI